MEQCSRHQNRIIEHLGLDYDTFINSAYLRQGHAMNSRFRTRQIANASWALFWAWTSGNATRSGRDKRSRPCGQEKELCPALTEIEKELARAEYQAMFTQAETEAQKPRRMCNKPRKISKH
jgi:DNA repair exonuclease SbcCD ATPase subunit